MRPCNPEPPADKNGHPSKCHPANRRMARTPRIVRAQIQAKAVEQPHHTDLNHMEKPQAEEHLQLGKIPQTKRKQHKRRHNTRKTRRHRNHIPPISPRQKRKHRKIDREPREHIPRNNGKRKPKTPLKQAIAHKRPQRTRRTRNTREFQQRGSNRKRQPLVFHPLFPQQNAETQMNRQNARNQRTPPEKHRKPLAPWERCTGHLPLVKSTHRIAIGNRCPTRHIGQEQLIEPVLWRRVIRRHRQHLQKPHREPLALHRRSDKTDTANREQFRWRKSDTAPLEKGVQNQKTHERNEHRHRKMRMVSPR